MPEKRRMLNTSMCRSGLMGACHVHHYAADDGTRCVFVLCNYS